MPFRLWLLKTAYERLRPTFDQPLLALDSYSFPSGHTAGATLFYGVLAAFLVARFFDWRARAACVAQCGDETGRCVAPLEQFLGRQRARTVEIVKLAVHAPRQRPAKGRSAPITSSSG